MKLIVLFVFYNFMHDRQSTKVFLWKKILSLYYYSGVIFTRVSVGITTSESKNAWNRDSLQGKVVSSGWCFVRRKG